VSAPSIWQVEQRWDGFPPLAGAAACDVAVIGAGVTGAACAWRLREHGRDAVLLEGRSTAAGASGRNGGFAIAGTALGPRRARRLLGEAAAVALERLTLDARERMIARAADLGAAGCVRRTGSLTLATAAEAPALEEHVRLLADAGIDCEPAPVPLPLRRRFALAALTPGDTTLQPAAWVRALVAGATRLGARVHERSPVLELAAAGGAWRLRTPAAVLEAESVVVCSDGLSARLVPELHPLVYPRARADARHRAARAPAARAAGGGRRRPPLRPADVRRPHRPRRRRPADREREYADQEVVNGVVQDALDAVLRDDLGVDPRAVEHRWAGIMGFSPDLLPLVGPVPGRPGLLVSAGYSGIGNVQGFVCGEIAADLVCGRKRPEATPLRPDRFWRDGRPLRAPPRLELGPELTRP
jgi:gamma-glutamylputrescine oxidase